ncbi:helix-turn-helix transcriptional regulator [Streptomyces yunnanensis]|uniref:Helix-turn-helix transcriptional regulator n=1 Tax=Streptomyces yunnanensis TaxID=156453 RepID=A0ABY8A9F1_9ACTN|nr:helix-turn-helix transcriptional regulator [Streptomyces yunnanensis]WEB41326.1 helix-turn-helix transcriptional regulator [Streptomyces yunnanensis]
MSNTYGDWFKQQRELAGLTQQQLADAAIMTRSHIAHIEAGRRVPSKEDAERLDRALGTGNVLSSFRPGGEVAVADRFADALALEQQATMIWEFASALVPGLFQTDGYARAVMRTACPPWSDEECDRLVRTRLGRAEILDDPLTPVVWGVLDEAVLRRPVGGQAVMAEQIMHLVRLAERGRVRIHVLPLGLGAATLMQGQLKLMWFSDQPPAGYTECVSSSFLHDSPAVVQGLQSKYALVLSDALPLQQSLALMRAQAKEYGHHG